MTPPEQSSRTYRRGASFVDCAVALSVIAGLAFVTVRMMSMGNLPTVTRTAETDTAVVQFGPPPPASDAKRP
jgi:hypothetical protein